MCNNCDCDDREMCSVIGYQPYGTCCPRCTGLDESHTCDCHDLSELEILNKKDKKS